MNKIFNIGLPKTGTSSLNEALNELGFKSKHFPQTFRKQTMEGCYRFADDDWQALTNFGEHFYPQLDQEYPGSKFILTVRNEDRWLESWEKQIGKDTETTADGAADSLMWYQPIKQWLVNVKKALTNTDMNSNTDINLMKTRIEVFGIYRFHAGRCRHVFRLHRRNVLEYFKDRPDDLLVMDICEGDGWEKLCQFLEIPEISDISFPHKRPPISSGT